MQADQVELNIQDVAEYGDADEPRAAEGDAGRAPLLGHLVGIQPDMRPADYATADHFRAKLGGYLDEVCSRGWLSERAVVIFPEHIGTWLVALGESEAAIRAPTIESAMRALVRRHPLAFAATMLRAALSRPASDLARYSLFRMKARRMAMVYQQTFAALARDYGVTIVAGSILLPSPRIANGRLSIGGGPLYNAAVVYGPDGRAHDQLTRKVYPIGSELPFTAKGTADQLPIYHTPLGKLAVLICADSWYPDTYRAIARQGAEFVAVPSFLTGNGIWDQPWRGYDGSAAPEGLRPEELDGLTEGQAWLRYALAGRLPQSGIRHGMNVFLRGQLWDLGSDGHTIAVQNGQVIETARVEGAALVSVLI